MYGIVWFATVDTKSWEVSNPLEIRKELEGNDIYFIEVLGDRVLVNDNYSGLLVYDSGLNLVESIKIMDDFLIESSVKKENELLLICPENECLVYLNIIGCQYKIISLDGWEEWIFSPLYEWQEDGIILSDYNGRLARVDLGQGEINGMDSSGREGILQQKQKLSSYLVEKMFLEEKRAVVENEDGDLELFDCADSLSSVIVLPNGDYHDFEMQGASLTEIGEDCVLEINLETNECQEYIPEDGYCFLRGKYMAAGQQAFLFLLSGDKADSQRAIIERHFV